VESYINDVPSSGGERLILAVKHPDIFSWGSSQIGVFIRKVIVSQDTSGGDVTAVRVRVNPVFSQIGGGAFPLWKSVAYPGSPLLAATETTVSQGTSYDIAQVGVNGGSLIAASGSAGDNRYELDLSDYLLPRGTILTVSCDPVNTADFRVSIEWVEDH
jgi:hypothetical protein